MAIDLTNPNVGGSTGSWGETINSNNDKVEQALKPDGTGTSVGLNVGEGAVLNVAGAANFTGTVSVPDEVVTTAALADDAITTDKVADDAITADKVADDAITADKVADDAVITDKIADDAITADKLAPNLLSFVRETVTTTFTGFNSGTQSIAIPTQYRDGTKWPMIEIRVNYQTGGATGVFNYLTLRAADGSFSQQTFSAGSLILTIVVIVSNPNTSTVTVQLTTTGNTITQAQLNFLGMANAS